MAVHATILAGGAGTRLWPRSRRGQPKHLLALQKGSAPLLRQTYERIRSLVDEVHVVTERSQVDSICEVLPRSEEHTSELQSRVDLVCRLLLEKTKCICRSRQRRRPSAPRPCRRRTD